MEDQESAVATLRKKLGLADYATVENCMAALIESYALEDYAPAEQRRLAGIQYEMTIRDFSLKNPFVFCNDISRDTAYIIKENNTAYPGVTPQATPVREYVSGTIAPHLIGTLGPIYPEEYESLKDKGYQLNDILGKSGIEQAMESSLRGTTGTRVLVRDASGAIVDEYESAAAVAGNSVVLTLDKNLQKTTEDLIMAKMAEMRLMQPTATKKWRGQDIRSGSVVLLDVKTGGVLVSASVPGYDLSTYSSEYANLLNDVQPGTVRHFCLRLHHQAGHRDRRFVRGGHHLRPEGAFLRRRLPLLRKRRVRAAMHRPPRKPQRRGRPAEILQCFLF